MKQRLLRLLINLLNRPDAIGTALMRCIYGKPTVWDRVRLRIAMRIKG